MWIQSRDPPYPRPQPRRGAQRHTAGQPEQVRMAADLVPASWALPAVQTWESDASPLSLPFLIRNNGGNNTDAASGPPSPKLVTQPELDFPAWATRRSVAGALPLTDPTGPVLSAVAGPAPPGTPSPNYQLRVTPWDRCLCGRANVTYALGVPCHPSLLACKHCWTIPENLAKLDPCAIAGL